MEERLAELQRLFEEEQLKSRQAEARAAKERRLREEEQRRREEEQRRREAAEADAQQSQPQSLIEFLEACHNLSLSLEVVTDASSTTQGDTTKPAGRPYPQHIRPWDEFPRLQESIWEKLSSSSSFKSQRVYPSIHQLEYVRKYIDPITSELGLRHYARETVENPVRTLIEEVYKEAPLREQLQLQGTMMFESHTNLPQPSKMSIDEEMEHMSIASHTGGSRAKGKGRQDGKASRQGNTSGVGRRRAGSADQFCIYVMADGSKIPVISIEYKPPHKVPLIQIIAGLQGEIHPAQEVIDKEGDDFDFLSKSLVAAVITQLFSYMVQRGIQWGYIYVGEAIIFLHIPGDPTTVLYHLSIPRLDFQEDDGNRFHRTSVAQIFAFFLNSLSAEAPSQAWHDAAARLDTWAVEYIDILKKIPETERKEPRERSYRPGLWKGFARSPIQTRARRSADTCKPIDDRVYESHDESDDNGTPRTPTPSHLTARRSRKQGPSTTGSQGVKRNQRKGESSSNEKNAALMPNIKDRPFCTQRCLLGLASGGDLDDRCPNVQDHHDLHIPLSTFLSLMCCQLANDRGSDAECKPLYLNGLRGVLFKVRLSSHGYTLVAKGMEKADCQYLVHESEVYYHLRSLQGSYIPVSLGIVDLQLPYYHDGGVYVSMLFLGWAGRPLYNYLTPKYKTRILDQANRILKKVHTERVLHNDAKPHNWLWDEKQGKLMLIDFERAEIRLRSPLGPISPNRKRDVHGNSKSGVKDDFDREVEDTRSLISQRIK